VGMKIRQPVPGLLASSAGCRSAWAGVLPRSAALARMLPGWYPLWCCGAASRRSSVPGGALPRFPCLRSHGFPPPCPQPTPPPRGRGSAPATLRDVGAPLSSKALPPLEALSRLQHELTNAPRACTMCYICHKHATYAAAGKSEVAGGLRPTRPPAGGWLRSPWYRNQ
jgi:hypothetical protein